MICDDHSVPHGLLLNDDVTGLGRDYTSRSGSVIGGPRWEEIIDAENTTRVHKVLIQDMYPSTTATTAIIFAEESNRGNIAAYVNSKAVRFVSSDSQEMEAAIAEEGYDGKAVSNADMEDFTHGEDNSEGFVSSDKKADSKTESIIDELKKKLGLFKETDVEKLHKLVKSNRGNVTFHEEEQDMMKEFDIHITHHAASSLSAKEMDSHSRTKICKEECFTNSEAFKRSAVYCVKRVLGLRFFPARFRTIGARRYTEL